MRMGSFCSKNKYLLSPQGLFSGRKNGPKLSQLTQPEIPLALLLPSLAINKNVTVTLCKNYNFFNFYEEGSSRCFFWNLKIFLKAKNAFFFRGKSHHLEQNESCGTWRLQKKTKKLEHEKMSVLFCFVLFSLNHFLIPLKKVDAAFYYSYYP